MICINRLNENNECIKITLYSKETIENFKKLINRAMNTFDTAPPELKIFADELIHGHALQDYVSQDGSKPLRSDK